MYLSFILAQEIKIKRFNERKRQESRDNRDFRDDCDYNRKSSTMLIDSSQTNCAPGNNQNNFNEKELVEKISAMFERQKNESQTKFHKLCCLPCVGNACNSSVQSGDNSNDDKTKTCERKEDFYHFEHEDFSYLKTTDNAPQLMSDEAAELVYRKATKFWAEVFGILNVVFAFFITFLLQFYR